MATFPKGSGFVIGYMGDPATAAISWTADEAPITGYNAIYNFNLYNRLNTAAAFSSYSANNYANYTYPFFYLLTESFTTDSTMGYNIHFTYAEGRKVLVYVDGVVKYTSDSAPANFIVSVAMHESSLLANPVRICVVFDGGQTENPYPVDPSGSGGGSGSGIPTPQYIETTDEYNSGVTTLLTTNAFTLFCPTNKQLSNFKNALFFDSDTLTNIQNMALKLESFGGSVTDYLFKSFHVPFALDSSFIGTAPYIAIGFVSCKTEMNYTLQLFGSYDFGSIEVPNVYGNALDYKGKTSLWLPYISYVELDTAAIVGKTLNIIYYVNFSTGDITAHIHVNGIDQYQFNGNCAFDLPITGDNTLSSALETTGKAIVSGIIGSV